MPGLKRLTDTVHRHGARVALQLAHAGLEAHKHQAFRHSGAIAPSVVPGDPYCEASCRTMTGDEIAAVVRAFGDGARRARKAGFDAVQVHGAHTYLVGQFLSPSSTGAPIGGAGTSRTGTDSCMPSTMISGQRSGRTIR